MNPLSEPMTRFELVTSSLPRKHSTPELHRHRSLKFLLSGRRDSNSRPSAWKADALPTELLPLIIFISMVVGVDGLEPTIPYGDRFTVCCNSHYATPPFLSRWRDSNPRPADYKSAALAN